MRRVKQLMGMPISIDIPEAKDDIAFVAAFKRLSAIDERFSAYKPNSELCRFQRGEIPAADLSAEMKQVIKACTAAKKMTNGYFSAYFSDKFNPTGYVKGWAIAEAGKIIEKQGYGTYCISAGGDILARSNSGKVWNIGIQDPQNRHKIFNTLSIANGAVATSGNYERGAHIINPKTKKLASSYLSVTISGPDIIMTDVLATAAFAAGDKAIALLKKFKKYKAILVRS